MGARLTSEERDILARAFGAGSTAVYVDGWTSERGRAALNKAAHLGLAKASVNRGWQYTTITYELTETGRDYLRSRA